MGPPGTHDRVSVSFPRPPQARVHRGSSASHGRDAPLIHSHVSRQGQRGDAVRSLPGNDPRAGRGERARRAAPPHRQMPRRWCAVIGACGRGMNGVTAGEGRVTVPARRWERGWRCRARLGCRGRPGAKGSHSLPVTAWFTPGAAVVHLRVRTPSCFLGPVGSIPRVGD